MSAPCSFVWFASSLVAVIGLTVVGCGGNGERSVGDRADASPRGALPDAAADDASGEVDAHGAPDSPAPVSSPNGAWRLPVAQAPGCFGGSSFDHHRRAPVKILASNLKEPTRMALGASGLYVLTGGPEESTVVHVPLAGGSPTVVAESKGCGKAIAVDSTSVFWLAVSKGDPSSGGDIFRAPLAGGAAVPITHVVHGSGIFVFNSILYFTLYLPTPFSLGALTLDGGVPVGSRDTTFVNGDVVAGNAGVFWLTTGYDGVGAPRGHGSIEALPLSNLGHDRVIANHQMAPSRIAVDDAHVYWTSDGGSNVVDGGEHGSVPGYLARASVQGGGVETLVTMCDEHSALGALAVADGDVYFAAGDVIAHVPVAGGPVAVVGADADAVAIGVDADQVYFAHPGEPGYVGALPRR
jgi:hypothetical protein